MFPANSRCHEASCTIRTHLKCEPYCYMGPSDWCMWIDTLPYVRKKLYYLYLCITCHCSTFISPGSQVHRSCAPLKHVMFNSFLTFLYIQSTHLIETCTNSEGQTALSCVQTLDKLCYIYCMCHHKVAMLLLWYSSLCVLFYNVDFKTFLIKQLYKQNCFWCSNILKACHLQTIGNYLMNYIASHPKQL
jgi:hypothetical protein